jgi:hypothetical protein
MIIEPKNIDFSKYKRFFTFGCSFTQWRWPTWVNIIKTQMPNAEVYNAGRGGAGNLYIALQYNMYRKKYNFCDTDLIMIMWTTFCREDRYVKNCWLTPGNIYTQDTYSKEFIEKYADPKGYAIRDLGLIDIITNSLQKECFDSVALMSVPPFYNSNTDLQLDDLRDLLILYNDTIIQYPKSFYEFQGNKWANGHHYYHPGFDNGPAKKVTEHHEPNYEDYHPNTVAHYNYLNYLGFKFDNVAEAYSKKTVVQYNSYTHFNQFMNEHSTEII